MDFKTSIKFDHYAHTTLKLTLNCKDFLYRMGKVSVLTLSPGLGAGGT